MAVRTDGVVVLTDMPLIGWENLLTVNNVTASASDPEFPITNVVNPSTSLKWKQDFTDSPPTTDITITLNLDGLGPVNYVGIAGHNLGTAGTSIALSAAELDSPQIDIIQEYVPDDDSPIVFIFQPYEVVTGSIQIRLQTSATAAEIAVIYVGTYMQLEEGIQPDHIPLPLGNEVDVVSGRSENGQFLGRIVLSSEARSTALISNLTKAWVRSDLMPFLVNAEEYPFFWMWSPLTYPDEVAYAWLENDPNPLFDIDGFGSVELSMAGLIE